MNDWKTILRTTDTIIHLTTGISMPETFCNTLDADIKLLYLTQWMSLANRFKPEFAIPTSIL